MKRFIKWLADLFNVELTREVTPATGVTLDQTELTLTAGKTADGPERRATWERPVAAHNV